MAGKIEEIIASMPTLKVELGDIFNFEGKCIDPLASEIIAESLGYALETSLRRLESVSKINPRIYENATESVLPAVKTLMEVIKKAPGCDTSTLATAEPKPSPRKPKLDIKKAEKKAEKTEKKTKKAAKTAGELVENLTAAKEKAVKEPQVETLKQEEVKALAKLDPEKRKDLEHLKKINIEAYEAAIEGLAKGVKTVKAPTPVEKVEMGKQFTIAYDGQEQTYHLVGDLVAGRADMQEADKNVIKLSEATALAKLVEGKKAGDDVFIEVEGKKYKAQIKDIKDGHLERVAPIESKEAREQKFKAAMLPYEKTGPVVQTFEQAKAPYLVGGSLQRKIGDKWVDFTPIKDEEDAILAQLVIKKGYKEAGKTSPASEFRIVKGNEVKIEGGK